jgi:nucleoid-associated protein YgaU
MTTTVLNHPGLRGAARRGVTRPAGAVRLTRRGRAVVIGLLLNLAVALIAAVALMASSGPADTHTATATVVVQPGDTLWGIATKAAPSADPRATIAELKRLNHLGGTAIEVGQELILPSR